MFHSVADTARRVAAGLRTEQDAHHKKKIFGKAVERR